MSEEAPHIQKAGLRVDDAVEDFMVEIDTIKENFDLTDEEMKNLLVQRCGSDFRDVYNNYIGDQE